MSKAPLRITLLAWAFFASGFSLGKVFAQTPPNVAPPDLISQWQRRAVEPARSRVSHPSAGGRVVSSAPEQRAGFFTGNPVRPRSAGTSPVGMMDARPRVVNSPHGTIPSMATGWWAWESEAQEATVTGEHPVLIDPFGDSEGPQTELIWGDSEEHSACPDCTSCDEPGCGCGIPALQPEWFGPPWAWPWWYGGPLAAILARAEIFIGAHGFKGSPDLGRNGNFGFHEGFNFGGPLGDPWGIGWQFGFRAAHSDFAGSSVTGVYDPGSRNQFFLSTGLFHRKFDCGLQWAVVFDYLHDNYYGSADLQQLRTEMSWKFGCQEEIGFWGAFMLGDDRYDYGTGSQAVLRDVESRDLYTLFYRRGFGCSGEGRIYSGFSGHGNGLLGVDFLLPVGERFGLEAGFAYLTPKGSTSEKALRDETWALTISLIWYPVRGNACAFADPFRPVMPVADNRHLIQRLP